MADAKTTPVIPAATNKPKKARKPPSAARVAAMKAVDDAKSDQEKTVARANLKLLRFKELGTKRLNRWIAGCDGLMNLSNRAAYQWTPDQAEKIVKTVRARADKIIGAFTGQPQARETIEL